MIENICETQILKQDIKNSTNYERKKLIRWSSLKLKTGALQKIVKRIKIHARYYKKVNNIKYIFDRWFASKIYLQKQK